MLREGEIDRKERERERIREGERGKILTVKRSKVKKTKITIETSERYYVDSKCVQTLFILLRD